MELLDMQAPHRGKKKQTCVYVQKNTVFDEMAGWHQQLNGHEFE